MPNHINAASRLMSQLLAARDSGQAHTFQAWAHAFGIVEESNRKTMMRVMQRLIWLEAEVIAVREAMHHKAFSPTLFEPALAKIENALEPARLPTSWQETVTNFINSEVLTSVGFCAEILPDEEAVVSEDDLAAITSLLAELEVLAQTASIPPRLRFIIQHHIELIHEALEKYPVFGVVALRDAAWTAAGELLHAKNDPEIGVDNFSDRPEVTALNALWTRVNIAVDASTKLHSLYELGKTVAELLPKP